MKAHARNTDPTTSHEAAASVDHPSHMQRVFDYFKLHSHVAISRFELANSMSLYMSESSARSRASELLQAGYLYEPEGQYRVRNGRRAKVLLPTEKLLTADKPPAEAPRQKSEQTYTLDELRAAAECLDCRLVFDRVVQEAWLRRNRTSVR